MADYKISQIDKDALVASWNNMSKSNADVVREMGQAMSVDTSDTSEASAVWRCIKKKISSSTVIQGLLTVDREGGVTGTHSAKSDTATTAATAPVSESTTATTAAPVSESTTATTETVAAMKFKLKIKGTQYNVEASDIYDAVEKVQQLMKQARLSKVILQDITGGRAPKSIAPTDMVNGGEYELAQQLSAAAKLLAMLIG